MCNGKSPKATPTAIQTARDVVKHMTIDKNMFNPADVYGLVDVGYDIEVPHEIFNEQEFREHHGCSMASMNLEPNVEIFNEKGEFEQVLLVRSNAPRRLMMRGTMSTALRLSHFKHRIRELQPEETFDQKKRRGPRGLVFR